MPRYAKTYARAQVGVDAPLVTVEAHIAPGCPKFLMVGLPETAVKESKERVRSALINNHFKFPSGRITIHLAPAELPKSGANFDLAIAIALLSASKQLKCDSLEKYEFIGELALSGNLHSVDRVLPAIVACKHDKRECFLPADNLAEAALVTDALLKPVKHLAEVFRHLRNDTHIQTLRPTAPGVQTSAYPDISEVLGQEQAKRALLIAAAGGHSILMSGPPGSGKSMLANRLPGLLPPLSEQAALTVSSIHALSFGRIDPATFRQRPFRAPHHTASSVAIIGGGTTARPGEISLAHQGVLFLDELPEFNRRALEGLREPLETQAIHISRANYQVTFPAHFQLIAAMNPCPCGQLGNPKQDCYCSPDQVRRYQSKISGPLRDRIDLHVTVPTFIPSAYHPTTPSSSSADLQQQVIKARAQQHTRQTKLNNSLSSRELKTYAQPDVSGQKLLDTTHQRLGFSLRVYHRILKIARSIADLEQTETITDTHLTEALSYRPIME